MFYQIEKDTNKIVGINNTLAVFGDFNTEKYEVVESSLSRKGGDILDINATPTARDNLIAAWESLPRYLKSFFHHNYEDIKYHLDNNDKAAALEDLQGLGVIINNSFPQLVDTYNQLLDLVQAI